MDEHMDTRPMDHDPVFICNGQITTTTTALHRVTTHRVVFSIQCYIMDLGRPRVVDDVVLLRPVAYSVCVL